MKQLARIPLHYKLFFAVLLSILCLQVVFPSNKVHADTYWPDGDSNSIPDWVENILKDSCNPPDPLYPNRDGPHTYHLTWVDPWNVTPLAAATTDTTRLKSVAYICPGVSYSYSNKITHTITSLPAGISLSTNTLSMGNAIRGRFSRVASITATINLSIVKGCADRDFTYDGYAYPGGSYDSFTDADATFYLCVSQQPPVGNPTITAFSANCNTAIVTATTPTGALYNARLLLGDGTNTPLLNQNIPSGSPTTFDTTSWRDFGTHSFLVRVTNDSTGETTTNVIPRNTGPCLKFACPATPFTTSKSDPEAGDTFVVTALFNVVDASTNAASYIGSRGATYNYYVRLKIDPFYPDTEIANGVLSHGVGTINRSSGTISAPTASTYTVNTYIRHTSGGSNLAACGDDINVTSKPYFTATNGDVAAGMGSVLGDSCIGWDSSTTGMIKAWNNSATSPNKGAGTNLAAFAVGDIFQFASAQSLSSAPTGLSFANPPLSYGGKFRGGINCPTDYFNALPPVGSRTAISGSFTPSGASDGAYYAASPGTLTINGTGFSPIGLGKFPRIYVDGDVLITGGITFTAGATTVSQIPNLYVVAKGNIYIAPNVQTLEGVYIAQPLSDGTKGKVYTCSNGFSFPTKTQLNTTASPGCKWRKLTVNGAVIAKEVKLYRSMGSLINFNTPAEVFNYTPANWLAVPPELKDSKLGDPYDAITSLPPVL